MIENNTGQLNTLIKLDIGDLIQDNSENNNENKENSEISNRYSSSINKTELKLDEEENNNISSTPKENIKPNIKSTSKNTQKKAKSRRSRLAIDPQEEIISQHPRKIYTEEEKIKKANHNSIYYNFDLINKRKDLNIHFLKRKIEQSYERDDKLQVFFNVPFFPKEEMFMSWQLTQNNGYLYNLNRNAQYNKMGMMQNRNINYQNNMRYMNNINNNIKNNIGNMNNIKNFPPNSMNVNINNLQNNIKNINNNIPVNRNQNIKPTQPITNINPPNQKPPKPILDSSLLQDSANKFNTSLNKLDGNNNHIIKKNPLFALKLDPPITNTDKDDINQSNKKENENNNNNNEVQEAKKEETNELKEIDINNKIEKKDEEKSNNDSNIKKEKL